MKKYLAISLFVSIFLFSAILAPVHAQNVDDFSFSSFEADYYLSRDENGASTMRVKEVLVAEFPDFNQNKGIVRAIPHSYQGRKLDFELLSLSRNGEAEPVYAQYESGPFMVIETGTNEFVRSTQKYEIEYRVNNVIRDIDQTQELFWDINGTGWKQRFDSVTARVHLESTIFEGYTGEHICYQGQSGSREQCSITTDDLIISFEATKPMLPEETLSIAIRFNSGTFTPYNEGFAGIIRNTLLLASVLLLAFGSTSLVRIKLKYRNARGRGVIVPEYLPPKNMSVFFASYILDAKARQKAFSAQIIELAVSKKIKIVESSEKRFLKSNTVYTANLIQNQELNHEENAVVGALFGGDSTPGATFTFTANNSSVAQKMFALVASTQKSVVNMGYRIKVHGIWIPIIVSVIGAIGAGIVTSQLHTLGANISITDYAPLLLLANSLLFIITVVIYSMNPQPLTEKGRGMYDYLKGLKMYISLAEADRLRYLQSPQGASKERIATDDSSQVIRLYERLLPYAILFGLEKEWMKVLGTYYEAQQQAPVWYAGAQAFSSGQLSQAIQSISTSAASSSGGSGFSGGGGAGGGGGGGGGGGR